MRRMKAGVPTGCLEVASFSYDDEKSSKHTSPKSPTNLRFARSREELAGRTDPPLSEGVSFTEELVTDDYWNLD